MKRLVIVAGLALLLFLSLGTTFVQAQQYATRSIRFQARTAVSSTNRLTAHQAKVPGTSYTYTLLSFPGTLDTSAIGINKGATTSKIYIAGEYDAADGTAGFFANVSGTKTVRESYEAVNYPHAAADQYAFDVNDAGRIVGQYRDNSDLWHGYEKSAGKFSTLNVPFTGATGTFPEAINDSEEIVGAWNDGSGISHGFTLIDGTYTSFDYPGAAATQANDVNNGGEIVGYYVDTSGLDHGFVLSGGTYTSIDVPGADYTFASGVNDSGTIVGAYCTNSQCLDTGDGEQGFLLTGGVFTTITIPGEYLTVLSDINNNGVLLGDYQDAAGLTVGFLATP